MGFLGMSGKTWKKIGGYALKAAPIVAAPFTGGASLLAIGAGAGAASGALGGGGWKGAALGGALGAVPGGGAGGAAAGTVAKTGLKAGLTQAAKTGAKQVGGSLASKYLPGPAGDIAGAAISGYGGGANIGANLKNAAKAGGTQLAAGQASRIPGVGGIAGGAVGAGVGSALNAAPGTSFGANIRNAGKAALQEAGAGGANMAGNYAVNSLVPQQGGNYGGLMWNNGQATSMTQSSSPLGKVPGRNPTSGLPQPSNPGVGASRPGTPGRTAAGPYEAPAAPAPGSTWQEKYGPIIAQAGGLGAGALAGQWATRSAMKRSPEEMQALTGAQGVGKGAASAAEDAMGESKPWMRQAGGYFSTLLSGNRAAMSQATAAPTAQISQQYRGAERGLERSGVRGAARDVAASELGRDRVSKIAGLTTGVQPYAAEQLGKLGLDAQGNAAGLYGVAGNVYGNLLQEGARNRAYGREEGEKTSKAIGGLTRDVGEAVLRKPGQPQTPVVTAPKKPVPGVPSTPTPTSGIPGNQIPGQQMPMPTAPNLPASRYPGGRVTPPILGGPATGDYDPTKGWGGGVRF